MRVFVFNVHLYFIFFLANFKVKSFWIKLQCLLSSPSLYLCQLCAYSIVQKISYFLSVHFEADTVGMNECLWRTQLIKGKGWYFILLFLPHTISTRVLIFFWRPLRIQRLHKISGGRGWAVWLCGWGFISGLPSGAVNWWRVKVDSNITTTNGILKKNTNSIFAYCSLNAYLKWITFTTFIQ